MLSPTELPAWTSPHPFEPSGEGDPRDPLRAQITLDLAADGLFRSGTPGGPGLTSLTDHLVYLAFHGWADRFARELYATAKQQADAYIRLTWIHAWANKAISGSDGGRWTVYGILALNRQKTPSIPGSRHGSPVPLVQLDPKARYAGLWDSVSERTRELTLRCWPRLTRNNRIQLRRWLSGSYEGLSLLQRSGWSVLRLNRKPRSLRPLALEIQSARVPETGLGYNLRPVTLGQVLAEVRRWRVIPSPDEVMWSWIEQPASTNPIRERIRRALLVRAVVFAVNWAFFAWAGEEIGVDQFRTAPAGCGFLTPQVLLARLSTLLRGDSDLRASFMRLDREAGLGSGRFSLIGAIEQKDVIQQRVIDWARMEKKGFVTGNRHISSDRAAQIKEFSGSYAGGLRLRQAWRFGRDISDALAT